MLHIGALHIGALHIGALHIGAPHIGALHTGALHRRLSCFPSSSSRNGCSGVCGRSGIGISVRDGSNCGGIGGANDGGGRGASCQQRHHWSVPKHKHLGQQGPRCHAAAAATRLVATAGCHNTATSAFLPAGFHPASCAVVLLSCHRRRGLLYAGSGGGSSWAADALMPSGLPLPANPPPRSSPSPGSNPPRLSDPPPRSIPLPRSSPPLTDVAAC
eukprot:200392-Chlamydomonas_euryale.AAC.4